MKDKLENNNRGYSLYEVVVVLLILGITMAVILPGEIFGRASFQKKAFERECEAVYYEILQFQNDTMMDGCQRQLRFLNNYTKCNWKNKDNETVQELIPIKEIEFSGAFTTGNNILTLYPSGTVSMGGTTVLRNKKNKQQVKKIVVQVGNGRIYLAD